jgi:hypothetical protein
VGEADDLVSLWAKRKEEKKNGPGKWAAREGRERGEGKRIFLKKNSFQIDFQTFKLQSNKKPCIRIIMHKHLLFLILFK